MNKALIRPDGIYVHVDTVLSMLDDSLVILEAVPNSKILAAKPFVEALRGDFLASVATVRSRSRKSRRF